MRSRKLMRLPLILIRELRSSMRLRELEEITMTRLVIYGHVAVLRLELPLPYLLLDQLI
jgi:hypothetical protein